MITRAVARSMAAMPEFLLHHRHAADDCATAFAAWRGFRSPLRGGATASSCLAGGHELWWRVEASGPDAALAMLPRYVAERTRVARVNDVPIP
jgi:hypothetical protein